MKAKPKIDTFLEGGATAAAVPPTEFRKQMVVQLPVALINDLKRRALEQSVNSGKRVTQQQLVEEALQQYLRSSI
jgi:hypothetical protein